MHLIALQPYTRQLFGNNDQDLIQIFPTLLACPSKVEQINLKTQEEIPKPPKETQFVFEQSIDQPLKKMTRSEPLLGDIQNLYTENEPYLPNIYKAYGSPNQKPSMYDDYPHPLSQTMTIKQDFEGKHKEELSLNKNDPVNVLLKNLPCFWYVENPKNKERGLVPAKYFVSPSDRFKIIDTASM